MILEDCEFESLSDETEGIENSTLCIGGINHSPLPGDSGGPLMIIRENRWVQVGVANAIALDTISDERISVEGIGNTLMDSSIYLSHSYLGICAKVSAYSNWITKNTGGEVTC